MKRDKILESVLVIVIGFSIIGLLCKKTWVIDGALILGILCLLSGFIATWVSWLWLKLGWIMGEISSKIILSILFFIILTPIAIFYRLFNKNKMRKKPDSLVKSYYVDREHVFTAGDLENMW